MEPEPSTTFKANATKQARGYTRLLLTDAGRGTHSPGSELQKYSQT